MKDEELKQETEGSHTSIMIDVFPLKRKKKPGAHI
jgi:hypothetical protein